MMLNGKFGLAKLGGIVPLCFFAASGFGLGETLRTPLPSAQYEGSRIAMVYLDLRDSAGTEIPEESIRTGILEAFGTRSGTIFSVQTADRGIHQLLNQPGVVAARYELYQSSRGGEVVLAIRATYDPDSQAAPGRGWFGSGDVRQFPTLFQNHRSLLRVQLNGGLGLFNDHDPWWGDADAFVGGSPLFPEPAGPGWCSWGEASIETGIHGIYQLGARQFYVFGNVSAVGAGSAGQDPWRSDRRFEVELEKSYAGMLYENSEHDVGLSVSYGSQPWQLNKGFLFSQYAGSFNAAQWGASYLAARTALEQAFLAKVRWSNFSVEAFLVDPQEYFLNDSGTEYRGVDLKYQDGNRIELGAVYYEVPHSASVYILPDGFRAPRRGLRTSSFRFATEPGGMLQGWQFEGEYAHQTNSNFAMSADAWYASVGYRIGRFEWRPNLSYRYALFEGDDPSTPTYERFDAPQSSGSDNWLQGNVFKKAVVNSNLRSHRIRFFLAPSKNVGVTAHYFYLWADELNNRGGAKPLQVLAGRSIGQEVDVTLSWMINRHFFLLGFVGIADPARGFEQTLGNAAPSWSTVQFSLFWNL